MLTSAQIHHFAAVLFPPSFQPLKVVSGWRAKAPESASLNTQDKMLTVPLNLAAVAQSTYGVRRGADGNRFLVHFERKTQINTGFCCLKTDSSFS